MSRVGGQERFISNLTQNTAGQAILRDNTIYIAGNKRPIGFGKRKVCRIDGTYFHEFIKSAPNANQMLNNISFNRFLKRNYDKCNEIIFQSNFSKSCFNTLFPDLLSKRSKIIRNAADDKIFFPISKPRNENIKLISVSLDYPIKRLHYFEELTQLLTEKGIKHRIIIISGQPRIKHRFVNKFKGSLDKLQKYEYISVFCDVDIHSVARMLQLSDVYVSFSHIDPCPNAVCEAVACGLPVIAPSSGGIPEITSSTHLYKKILSENFYFNWFQYEEVCSNEVNAVAEKVELIVNSLEHEMELARVRASLYTFNDMVNKYVEFLT